ncbi:erythromycin esterase family protein [Streptomyces sp. CoH17]|uniref:erythromycin esterase family protein n=1 Tax=Streptomyces sp. CoH17 TaxID=2992806 RepID=UPI0022712700|nr:erythromycin esterase family protein [Streptomyces sp. CoH17]
MTQRAAILLSSALLALATMAAATPAMADATAQRPTRITADTIDSGTFSRSTDRTVRGIERSAHVLRTTDPGSRLRDLDALDPMVGNAQVVGLGEATHGSREFFRMKHRVLRHLVRQKGFRAFALELPWSSGLRLDDYVVHGKGDLEDIAHDEFQGTYDIWNNQDYRDLIAWIRNYNMRHPHDPVHFVGTDMGYAGPELYDRITDYVSRAHPELRYRVAALYEGLRPTTDAATYSAKYSALSLAERKDRAGRTGEMLDLLEKARPGRGASARAQLWAVQNARAVHQMAEGLSFDVEDEVQVTQMMKYRDRTMAANTLWWNRNTGNRILLSAHNTHVSYDSFDPRYPKTEGAFLRDALGGKYLSIGFSFYEGAFKAFGTDDGVMRTRTIGGARPGSNEYTLDEARQRDYILDIRTAPPAVRAWLDQRRTTYNVGAGWPDTYKYDMALGEAHDVLVHLHKIHATTYLGTS